MAGSVPGRGTGAARPFGKPRDTRKVLLRLWSYLYYYKWMLLGGIVLTITSNLLALVGPALS